MSKSTTIVTTTTALADIATSIAADAAVRAPSKQRILNAMAAGIAGPKHDWGFLTGASGPVIQKGIAARRLAEVEAVREQPKPAMVRAEASRPALEVVAEPVALYPSEVANYLASQLSGDLLTISESFSTDTENARGVQCMLAPTAIFARDDRLSLAPMSLWGASPDLIERAGRAYFAASSSPAVNDHIMKVVCSWPEIADATEFRAFHFAHAVVVTTDDPFATLTEMEEALEEDADPADLLAGAIRIFVDETQTPAMREQTLAEAESFLNRLARFLDCDDPRFGNIAVR